MTHHDATRSHGRLDPSPTFLKPEGQHDASHETGGPTRSAGSQRRRRQTEPHKSQMHAASDAAVSVGTDTLLNHASRRGGSLRRRSRPKSTGGFLLSDSTVSSDGRVSSRASPLNGGSSQSPPTSRSARSEDRSPIQSQHEQKVQLHDANRGEVSGSDGSVQSGRASRESDQPSPQALPPNRFRDDVGDLDSSQIVQMALSLSESRRIASRRHVSHGTPPRLGPLPDGSSGSNLRQHLQQQRRSLSFNAARGLHGSSPRPTSGRFDGSSHTGFEGGNEYHYHFSASTLERAQKAKDHLELMAQYRRLLSVLPPLKPDVNGKQIASPPASPPASDKPFIFSQSEGNSPGRQYNPLQYIRNRKVRARERKVIDGEKQGFGDVELVKPWVDRILEKSTSSQTSLGHGQSTMLPFPGIEDAGSQALPEDNIRAARVRRPRIDWFFEPCDVVADAYWLEQQRHKELIEDRNWRKIFPSVPAMSRPMDRVAATTLADDSIPPFSMQDDEVDAQISGVSKIDTAVSHSSAKDRAKQTIHNIRAFPHRHIGHNMHTDFTWHRKDSTSDISGSENDGRRPPARTLHRETENGTITQKHRNQLENQMLDMISRDARDRDLSDANSEAGAVLSPGSLVTPERHTSSQPASRYQSQGGSLIDTSDSDWKPGLDLARPNSPPRPFSGRQSLDVPNRPRTESFMREASLPTSPELRPTLGSQEAIGNLYMSPTWSRSTSPHRNPISKIKQIIRDKSGEPIGEREDSRRDSIPRLASSEQLMSPVTRPSTPSMATSPGLDRVPLNSSRTHRRTGSTRLRADDQLGLRGIFKGPRIDTVIRGGVSKIGDMLWKREEAGESPSGTDVTDDSEGERPGGRPWSANASRRASRRRADEQTRSKLENIAQSDAVYSFGRSGGTESSSKGDSSGQGGANRSQRLSRLDTLRPLQIDTKNVPKPGQPESYQDKISDAGPLGTAATQKDTKADSALKLDNPSKRSRHWSIADGTKPSQESRFTRRDVARMRAIVLSTGIKALEISRRAQAPPHLSPKTTFWVQPCNEAQSHQDVYVLAGRALSSAIQSSGRRWQSAADHFTYTTSPQLQNRVGDVRSRIADDLSEQSRQTSDMADETSRDLALGQPLKVKAVLDTMDKMLRRRRRRLRWIRRALWLMVEWALVGLMWYVWFMVVILRGFLGVGKTVVKATRWLLWL